MIRHATSADIHEIESIWQTCFGDSKAYIEAFMKKVGKPERCLVYELNEDIVSMMFVLPAQIVANGELRSINYIYACATLPEYRKQGIMNQLFECAKSEAAESSVFALVLIPSDEYLFEYYHKIGFQRLFKKPSFRVQNADLSQAIPFTEESIEKLISLRQNSSKEEMSVIWSSEYLTFALQDHAKGGCSLIIDQDGYCMFSNTRQTVVKEAMPLNKYREQSTIDYAVIYFCEPYQLPKGVSPYINFGLD